MKRFLETRGADGGRWRRIYGLPALFVGLLYDATALDAAWDLVKDWTAEERQGLRDSVPKGALDAPFRKGDALAIASEVVRIAASGLGNRNRCDGKGRDESIYLEFVEEVIRDRRTPADELLARFNGPWRGNVDKIFEEYAF
jgi:glutamate--cysteine ligase